MHAHGMPGHLIRRLYQIATQRFINRMNEAGYEITPVQFAAIDALREHPEIDQATLAALIIYDRATIGGVVDRLVAKGLVERDINPQDRRSRILKITDRCDAIFNDLLTTSLKAQDDILSNLSAAEREEFMTLSSKITDDIS